MSVIDKLPLSLPAYVIIGLLASSVVPWLLLRMARRKVPFQPVLRMFCYLQGGPGTVVLLLILLSLPILGHLHASFQWVQFLALPTLLWSFYLATLHLSAAASTSRWICMALLLASGLISYETRGRMMQEAADSFSAISTGMWPTLRIDDTVITNKLAPRFRPLRRHELVSFLTPDEGHTFVSRVVGLPTEIVAIRDKTVLINGVPLDETFLVMHTVQTSYPFANTRNVFALRDNMPPYQVPEREYFVLGDNRDDALDSRFFGTVPAENILGVVYFRIYPVSRAGPFTGDHSPSLK